LSEDIFKFELRQLVKGYKFGVIYASKGQTKEEEFYGNTKETKQFTEFLEWIGNHITLKNWNGYSAGLDVTNDKTGTHSYHREFCGFEVMFHVSTKLPYIQDDEQQLERKRHIGNDVVVIIFQDGDEPFDPSVMHSIYNHVYFIIRKDKKK